MAIPDLRHCQKTRSTSHTPLAPRRTLPELSQCRSSFPLHITHAFGPSSRPRVSNNRHCQPLIFPNFLTNFAHYQGQAGGGATGRRGGSSRVGCAIKIKIHAQAKDITRFPGPSSSPFPRPLSISLCSRVSCLP